MDSRVRSSGTPRRLLRLHRVPRRLFGHFEWAATQQSVQGSYLTALGELFKDVEDARSRYRAGQFVHAASAGVSGGGARTDAFCGGSFIPRMSVEKELSQFFELAASPYDPTRYDQMAFILQRKTH